MKNKYKIGAIVISAVLLVSSFTATFIISDNEPDPIYISSYEDFRNIENNLDGYFVLRSSLTLPPNFVPIGTSDNPFTGTFEGNHQVIYDNNFVMPDDIEKYSIDGSFYYGLFPFNDGIIKNLELSFVSFQDFDLTNFEINDIYVGSFVGLNNGIIQSCGIFGAQLDLSIKVNSSAYIGGICGFNKGEIYECVIKQNISPTVFSENLFFGGFTGRMSGTISIIHNSRKNGWLIPKTISNVTNSYLGGFVGLLDSGEVYNCYSHNVNTGTSIQYSNTSLMYSGGFVGVLGNNSELAKIKDSASLSSISSKGLNIAVSSSFVGFNDGKSISNISFENLLSGGSLLVQSNSTSSKHDLIEDGDGYTNAISNCFRAISLGIDENFILQSIEMDELTLKIMKWDDEVWRIVNGSISFLPINF